MNIKTIAFDADDTLWVNETYFLEAEQNFCALLSQYQTEKLLSEALYETQIKNLPFYGYGIKGYILSMIEVALTVSNHNAPSELISKIVDYGKELIEKPIVLLDGVADTLEQLKSKYKIVVATKGDLLDQHRKLHKSGLGHYFHHIEVMSDKKQEDYKKLLQRLEIKPENFLMIGNSLKSDILPVLTIGAHAYHIPFHTTWAHEMIDGEIEHDNFKSLKKISEILPVLLK